MKNVCGECRFFKTSACSLGPRKAKDPKCEEFMVAEQKPQKRARPVFKDSGLADEGYFEAIYNDDKPCFLTLKNGEFNTTETITLSDQTFSPKEAKRIPYEPYRHFKEPVPDREHLFWLVRREFQRFVDIEPFWLDVLTACVLLSYQQEKLLTVPYIYVYGDNESGKSTVLQLLKFLCYRPMYGVTVPPADLYGYLEDSDSIGCILEDELQGIHKDIDKIKIYKAGYKQGAIVPRTFVSKYTREIRYYNTFCFKACASEQIPWVKGFRERFIEISMVEGFPEKEWADLTSGDLKRLYDLRNMLLKWRMLSREWQLPTPEVSMRGRLKELWKPILQVTHGLVVYEALEKFVDQQRNERIATKQNTLEGHIVKVVVDLYNQAEETSVEYIPFSTIWFALIEELDGKVDDKKPHVMDTSEFFRVTKSKVGYRLREVLSGKSKTVRQKIEGEKDSECPRIRAYEFDEDKVRRVAKKYGFEFVTKLSSEQSSQSIRPIISTPEPIENHEEKHENNNKKRPPTPQKLSSVSNSVTASLEEEEQPTTCWICHKQLPSDWKNVTFEEQKPCHVSCAVEWRKGRQS